ncbi:hypothetical protein GCM10027075_00590 [Streptomyces heilongjiangensis]
MSREPCRLMRAEIPGEEGTAPVTESFCRRSETAGYVSPAAERAMPKPSMNPAFQGRKEIKKV